MSMTEHRLLQESDDSVGIVIYQENLDRQIVLGQCCQFMRGVLKTAITGNANHSRWPALFP